VESQTEEMEQPLHEAARRGNLDFLRQCLQHGVSGTGLDNAGNTPLYWASHAGHVDCVRELLALPRPAISAQVSQCYYYYYHPLTIATNTTDPL
jgi:ankyrin repeat protein